MGIINGLGVTIVALILFVTFEWIFSSKEEEASTNIWHRRTTSYRSNMGWSILCAIALGVVNLSAPTANIPAVVVCLVVMIGYFAYLWLLWGEKGERILQLLCMIGLLFLGYLVTKAVVARLAEAVAGIKILPVVLLAIPRFLLIVSIGAFVVNLMQEKAIAKWLVKTVAIVFIVVLFWPLLVKAKDAVMASVTRSHDETAEAAEEIVLVDDTEPEVKEGEVTPEELEAIEHLTVKLTSEELEEITVAKYDGISEVLLQSSLSTHDKERTKSTGFSDALTYGFKSKDEAKRFAELEEEILRNPVYGVTIVNAIRGKTIGGKTIESFNPWMTEMSDKAKKGVAYWLEYRDDSDTIYVSDEYREYAATLCTWLERLVSRGEQSWQTIENWCLNAVAKNNDRKGVKADYQYKKEALILSYVGKDGSVLFTMGINIHDKRPEFYGPEPEKPENPKPKTPEKPTPDKPDKPDNPGGNGDNPKPTKDPSKSPTKNTEPNDDPGPGPNTNNGKGSQTAPADKPTNSNHGSNKDYEENLKDLQETNQNQKTGNDNNTPSTPSGGAKVDNNGDQGTGNGGINDPTPKQDKAKEAETGKDINDKPGEAWGGPPD